VARGWLDAVRSVTSGTVLRCLLFTAIFSLAAVPPIDPDLWWHLANGRLMIATVSIPHVDVYSFSAAGQPWVMHEWLADLGMYGLFKLGGLPVLVAFFAAVVVASAGCLYWLLRRASLTSTAAVVLTLVGALAGSTAWGSRPQLLNTLFAGVLLIGLLRYRQGRLQAWMLPPFLWLWANLHSGFVVGLIISGLFVLGEAFDAWRGVASIPRPRIIGLGGAIAASVVLAAVNPFGIQTLLFAFGTLTSPLIQNNIQEWASPDFHSVAGLMFEAVVFVMLAGLATRRVALRASEWLIAFALLYLAFSSQRHVPLFILGAAPLYGRCAQALLEAVRDGWRSLPIGPRLGDQAQVSGSTVRLHRAPRWRGSVGLGLMNLVLLVLVGAGMIGYRALPNLEPATEAEAISTVEPVQMTDLLAHLGRPVRVFNYYDYGGYLLWRLYPSGGRVYIDGRVEVYGPRVFADYLRVNYLAQGWPSVIAGARPDAIVLPSNHPLVRLLQSDPGWQNVGHGRVATLFVRVGFDQ
jgi:hypothetical protein